MPRSQTPRSLSIYLCCLLPTSCTRPTSGQASYPSSIMSCLTTYPCRDCNKNFATRKGQLLHMFYSGHMGGQICETCNETCATPEQIGLHQIYHRIHIQKNAAEKPGLITLKLQGKFQLSRIIIVRQSYLLPTQSTSSPSTGSNAMIWRKLSTLVPTKATHGHHQHY